MKNTYVKCASWSWEDKLLYIKACIGDAIPHNKICGHATLSEDELLSLYRGAWYIYCCDNGMIVYDGSTNKPAIGGRVEIKLSSLKQEKPTPTKFVKVEESIFDLKEEFEKGGLYRVYAHHGDNPMHGVIDSEFSLIQAADRGNVYRKVEIDWRDEVKSKYSLTDFRNLDDEGCINLGDWTPEGFIKLCHFVAELTDKPE